MTIDTDASTVGKVAFRPELLLPSPFLGVSPLRAHLLGGVNIVLATKGENHV